MATHSSVLAWRFPGMGSHRVGHYWSDLAVYCREKQPPSHSDLVSQRSVSHSGSPLWAGWPSQAFVHMLQLDNQGCSGISVIPSWVLLKCPSKRKVSWRIERCFFWVSTCNSDLKEINPEYSLEGLVLKLKLQYSCHLMWRADSLEKTLMLRKIEGRRTRGW